MPVMTRTDQQEATVLVHDPRGGPPPHAIEPFSGFYRRSYAPLVRLLTTLTGRQAIAEELAQESLLAAYRRWHVVSGMDRPDLWVQRVAINRSISLHRRLVAEVAALTRFGPERRSDTSDQASDELLWSAVRRLPRRQAAAVLLWAVGGYSFADIGDVLGCSPETARTHLRRARQRLAQELGEQE